MRAAAVAVQEVRAFIPKLWGLIREVFHEVMGFVFFAVTLFFVFGGQGLIRSFQKLDSDPEALGRLILVALFALMFCGFGVSSFRRAKRISKTR